MVNSMYLRLNGRIRANQNVFVAISEEKSERSSKIFVSPVSHIGEKH